MANLSMTDRKWAQLVKSKQDELKVLLYEAYHKAYKNIYTAWLYIILYANGTLDLVDDTRLDNLTAENKTNGKDYIILCFIHSQNNENLKQRMKKSDVNRIISNLVNTYTNLSQDEE